MMKFFITLVLLLKLTLAGAQPMQDTARQDCERTINSVIAIYGQLSQNPAFKPENLTPVIKGQADDSRMLWFLNQEVVPRLLSQGPERLVMYLKTQGFNRCADIVNGSTIYIEK